MIKIIIFITKHISISKGLYDNLKLNSFRMIDKINPIMQNIKKLLYLKFCFVQVFNIIFASPTDAIENIIRNKYPFIPNFCYIPKKSSDIFHCMNYTLSHYNYFSS